MPHFNIEYSRNLEQIVDMAALCNTLRLAGIETGVFPLAGIRVRAFACDFCSIADGDPKHGFIDISVRLRAGRTLDVKKGATHRIFEAAQAFLAPAMAHHSIALSLEIRDIDPDLSAKTGTIRDHLEHSQ